MKNLLTGFSKLDIVSIAVSVFLFAFVVALVLFTSVG